MTGKVRSLAPRLFLYFDNNYLQAARWGKWKLHVARYDIPPYNPAMRQRQNKTLAPPELYNLEVDPDESYDLASEHPEVIKDLKRRIAEMMGGFPVEVQQLYSQ